MAYWQLWKQGISWPVSLDHIVGSGYELIKVECFLKLITDQVLVFRVDHRLVRLLLWGREEGVLGKAKYRRKSSLARCWLFFRHICSSNWTECSWSFFWVSGPRKKSSPSSMGNYYYQELPVYLWLNLYTCIMSEVFWLRPSVSTMAAHTQNGN